MVSNGALRSIGLGILGFGAAALGVWVFTTPEPQESWGEVDPAFLQALALYEAWDGSCDVDQPETRSKVEAGAKIFQGDAVACLLPDSIFDGRWRHMPEDARAALLPLLARHYAINHDERVLSLEICDILPALRVQARSEVRQDRHWITLQPHRYKFELPEPEADYAARDRFFACPDWTLEDYKNHQESGQPFRSN